jgi:hypothetical protein
MNEYDDRWFHQMEEPTQQITWQQIPDLDICINYNLTTKASVMQEFIKQHGGST